MVHNQKKLDDLLAFHRDAAAMYRKDAAAFQQSTHPEAPTEAKACLSFAKEHDDLTKKIVTAAQKAPWKLEDLANDDRLTPAHLRLNADDIYGPE